MIPLYDVDTPEGLAAAIEWQKQMIEHCSDQARWIVPRSSSIIVIDKTNKRAIRVLGAKPETSIQKVFEAMGWQWIDKVAGEEVPS